MNFYHKYCNVTTFLLGALPLNNGLVSYTTMMLKPMYQEKLEVAVTTR
jgi:hypothetical protein